MMEQDYNIKHWTEPCRKVDCRKNSCKCGIEKVFIPAAMGDDSEGSPIAPANGAYCNALVVYEANGHKYIYSKEGIPTLITSGGGGDYDEIIKEIQDDLAETENDLAQEVLDRAAGDNALQGEIDAIKNSPDVVDIVPTYAALQAYDTSSLGDNDIIRVLQDEQHDGQSTYYRWNKQSSTWTYIGAVGDYYTKGQVDTLLTGKQDTLTAGANITISANNEISATDTTYTHFTGATASTDGTQGLVPGPLAGDEDKFLKADGTWATAGGGGPTVVQSTGASTADVMSQDAVTKMINPDITNYPNKVIINSGTIASNTGLVINGEITDAQSHNSIAINAGGTTKAAIGSAGYAGESIAIGASATVSKGYSSIAIGSNAYVATSNAYLSGIAIGPSSNCGGNESLAIGYQARTNSESDVALGKSSNTLGTYSTAIGASAKARSERSVAIGASAMVENNPAMAYSVALGASSVTTRAGEVNVGTGTSNHGYNSTPYRVIGGVHDGQLAQDAVTVNQVNSVIDAINTALSTNIPHIGA